MLDMRVLVCGSRHYNDYEDMERILDEIPISLLIEGEARGADRLARDYAKRQGIPVLAFPAQWDLHGKAAGPIRNTQMLAEGKPDLVVAFLTKDSRGTKNMIEQAQKAGVEVRIINI